jgi:hypothetical protein
MMQRIGCSGLGALLAIGCSSFTSPPTPTPTPTPAPTPTPISTSTPEPTRAPTYGLLCHEVIASQTGNPVGVYAPTGSVFGAASTSVPGVQVIIIGEEGDFSVSGENTLDVDYSGNMILKIDEEWVFDAAEHTYQITGQVFYHIPAF